MILDFTKIDGPPPRPRVLVVGAGAAGIVLAVALARRGVEVLLCEAGGRSVEPASQALNDAVLRGRQHAGITEGRARVLGGTTTLWGGQLISFREIDFRSRPWLGLDAWPITRSDVAPYYEAVAKMLGLPVSGDDDAAVWEALGLKRPEFGANVEFVLTRWLKEANLASAFRSDLQSNPKLTVLLHATATGFVSGADGAISAAILRSPRGRSVVVEADHIVIATGTIEASRLMLAAAAQNTALPWAGNPNVGAAFQDHLDVRAAEVTVLDKRRFSDTFDNIFLKGFKYNPKVILAPHIQEEAGITNVGAVFTFESSLTEHLSNLKIFLRAMRNGAVPPNIRAMPAHLKALAKVWWPLIRRYLQDNRAFNPADLGISLRLHCEQKPIARSRITLDSTRMDANGMPLAVLDWQIDGIEVEAMAVFCERVGNALAERGLARLEIDPRILARDIAILDDARDTNHHCGGLRMAASPTEGVVDGNCCVHGTTNLHIAGAAVYPSSSFANPTFTAMALALRLADRIAGQL